MSIFISELINALHTCYFTVNVKTVIRLCLNGFKWYTYIFYLLSGKFPVRGQGWWWRCAAGGRSGS